jgi:hypothetical protein
VGGTCVELAGVIIVSDILPNFLLGGVGGLTNAGLAGADVLSGPSAFSGVVEIARPKLYAAAVLTARFLRLRPRFPGVAGLGTSTGTISESGFELLRAVNREASMAKFMLDGDCGEGPGDGSVIDEESNDIVVVGEESAESDAEVDVELRGW